MATGGTPTGRGPGRRKRTVDFYNEIKAAFSKSGGKLGEAARLARVDPATAKRAWDHGWEGLAWAPPIKQVLDEERAAARQKVAEYERATDLALASEAARRHLAEGMEPGHDLEMQRQDAIRQRAQEGQLARQAVEMAHTAYEFAMPLHKACVGLSRRLAKEIENSDCNPKEALRILTEASQIAYRLSEVASKAFTMQRLTLGEPTAIVGGVDLPVEAMLVKLRDAARRNQIDGRVLDEIDAARQLARGGEAIDVTPVKKREPTDDEG